MAATTTKRKPVHHESLEQRAVIQWADLVSLPGAEHKIGSWLMAVPNGGARRPVEAAIMKAEGVRVGVPDLHLAWPWGGKHGLWIEMKRREGGTVSREQREWISKLRAAGYAAEVCRGADEAIATIKRYLGLA